VNFAETVCHVGWGISAQQSKHPIICLVWWTGKWFFVQIPTVSSQYSAACTCNKTYTDFFQTTIWMGWL